MHHDGVGAKELQTQAGTGTLKVDFSNINKGAVEMALPIAKTAAIKDAADHLGQLFGRDLNRKDTIEYKPTYAKPEASVLAAIQAADTHEQLEAIRDYLTTPKLNEAWKQRSESLA